MQNVTDMGVERPLAAPELEIKVYLRLIWRWLWLLILCGMVGGAAAYVFSQMSTPIYQASSTLMIDEGSNVSATYQDILTAERKARTYAAINQRPDMMADNGTRTELPQCAREPDRHHGITAGFLVEPGDAVAKAFQNRPVAAQCVDTSLQAEQAHVCLARHRQYQLLDTAGRQFLDDMDLGHHRLRFGPARAIAGMSRKRFARAMPVGSAGLGRHFWQIAKQSVPDLQIATRTGCAIRKKRRLAHERTGMAIAAVWPDQLGNQEARHDENNHD